MLRHEGSDKWDKWEKAKQTHNFIYGDEGGGAEIRPRYISSSVRRSIKLRLQKKLPSQIQTNTLQESNQRRREEGCNRDGGRAIKGDRGRQVHLLTDYSSP